MFDTGSPHRPISLRMRDDLKIAEHVNRGEPTVVVGDMLALEFYRMNEQEFFLLKSLDGDRSADQIKVEFEESFAPYQINYREIQQYLIDFHKKALVTSDRSDRGRHLHRLGRQKIVKKKLGSLKNLLAIRFRGINPDLIFRFLTPLVGWFFSGWMVCLNVVFMFAALLWLGTHYDEFSQRLPSMQDFFSRNNWISLACVMVVMKVLHEFGHGLVFTKYGGRCHELGVMLLVFMPTLYVNTSDSWRLTDKWKRAAIAAAGVYVELCLAALATFAWWYSKPGGLQFAFLNVMVLGSLSAFMFNGNPLLKFDAYYLLADLIEMPNLQQRSQRLIRNMFLSLGLGVREGDEQMLPGHTQRWLASYAVLAFLYRLFVVYFIAFIIVGFFRPAGLESFAKMFSFFTMSMIFVMPTIALIKYFSVPGRIHKIESGKARVTGAIAGGCLLFFFAAPLPDSVVCQFIVQPKQSQTVYVQHDAILKEIHVEPLQHVMQGDPIATLRNIDVELEIADLEGVLRELESEQRMIRLARYDSSRSGKRARNLHQEKITAQQRLLELKKMQSAMILIAPRDGAVITQWQHKTPSGQSDSLDLWDGWALHNENVNTSFQRGQPICKIGDLSQPEAHLMIDQSDIKFVTEGQAVELMLDSQSSVTFESRVASISLSDSHEVSANLTQEFGGQIETKQFDSVAADEIYDPGKSRPQGAIYEAVVSLPENVTALEDGLRGTARVSIGRRTLAGRMYRFLQKTFQFDL